MNRERFRTVLVWLRNVLAVGMRNCNEINGNYSMLLQRSETFTDEWIIVKASTHGQSHGNIVSDSNSHSAR